MSDLISRADALVAVCKWCEHPYCKSKEECGQWIAMTILPSADAEPKWNCTASFVAEQLDRLRKMTDEEKWEFFKRFFEMKGSDTE